MAKSDPDKLAAALRENLRKRKEQARVQTALPSHGNDEQVDVVMPTNASDRSQPSARKV